MTGAFDRAFAERKTWKINEPLLDAICATIPKGSSVIDLGAGIGRYVEALRHHGYQAEGVDGIEGIEHLSGGKVLEIDLTTRPQPKLIPTCDWALCIEVGEHIPAQQSWNFVLNLVQSAEHGLIVSWGAIGLDGKPQRGRDHVHCQIPEWVACQIGRAGEDVMHPWRIDTEATLQARRIAGKGWDKKMLVFTPG